MLTYILLLLGAYVGGVLSHKYVVAAIIKWENNLKQKWVNEFAKNQFMQIAQPARAALPSSVPPEIGISSVSAKPTQVVDPASSITGV